MIQELSRTSNMNKIACKNIRNFLHHELCIKKSAKIPQMCFLLEKTTLIFSKIFLISLAKKKRKKQKW